LFFSFQLDTLFYRGREKVSDPTPYRIVLADDHKVLRRTIKMILAGRGGLEVVGEAADGLELLNLLKMSTLTPHMAIVDITMPNLGGIETTRRIKMTYPDVKVLILTIHTDKEYLDQAFSAGAEGYLVKEEASNELFSAIETIRQGGIYVSPLLSGRPGDEER
jgi:DNA-binding NarL/FixJ family response regulator